PSTYSDGDAVTFDDTLTGTNVISIVGGVLSTVAPSTTTVNNSLTNYTFNGSGKITGTNFLTKSGTATLTLANTGVNDFTGGILINNGTLQIGNGGANGSLGNGPVTNNSSLTFSRSDNVTVTNVISGTGKFTQTGTGTLTLNASNTYSGNTVVSSGTLAVNGTLQGLLTNASGTTVVGTGTNLGLADLSGTINPGTVGSAGTLTIGNGLTLESGAVAKFDLTTNNTTGSGVNDLIIVTNNLSLNN